MVGKRKICHMATVAGSLYALLLNQLRFLRDECGYEVHGAAADDEWAGLLRKNGFPLHPVSLKRRISPISDIKALFELYLLFKKERFQIVHVHTPKAAFLGAVAAWLAGTPVRIYTIHGFYFHEATPRHRYLFFWFFEFIISRCVHYAFSQNSEDYSLALRTRLYNQSTLASLGNGIDLHRFRPNPDLKPLVRRELGLPNHSFVMGIIGRLTHEKGHREFIRSLGFLVRSGYPVAGGVIGTSESSSLNYYLNLTKSLGLEERIRFFGWQEDLERLYPAFDVFVLPSYREGFPRTPMEACASGIPCILSNIRGCREVVKDGVNGFLVPVKSVRPLAQKIELLINDPGLRTKMGKEARMMAAKKFDERTLFQTVAATYDTLLRKTASGKD